MPNKNKQTPTNFIATVFGELIPLKNSGYSRARLKIFYPGANRNGSYIEKSVGEQMISTLPGTPVVGFYDVGTDDYLDHMTPQHTKAYGFVPTDSMNFQWELMLDPDGVYRTYACADLILWTARYPEAKKIVGKSHSMELNPKTISGEFKVIDGEEYFNINHAEFFGLCVLGDNVEPCFEGSSFYSLKDKQVAYSTVKSDLTQMQKEYYELVAPEIENKNGGQEMIINTNNTAQDEIVDETTNQEGIVNDVTPKDNQTPAVEPANEPAVEPIVEPEAEVVVPAEGEVVEGENQEVDNTNTIDENQEGEENEGQADGVKNEEENQEINDASQENNSNPSDTNQDQEIDAEQYTAIIAEKEAEITRLQGLVTELQEFKSLKEKQEKQSLLKAYENKLTNDEYSALEAKLDSFANCVELKKEIGLVFLDKFAVANQEEENDAGINFSLVDNAGDKTVGLARLVGSYVKK